MAVPDLSPWFDGSVSIRIRQLRRMNAGAEQQAYGLWAVSIRIRQLRRMNDRSRYTAQDRQSCFNPHPPIKADEWGRR